MVVSMRIRSLARPTTSLTAVLAGSLTVPSYHPDLVTWAGVGAQVSWGAAEASATLMLHGPGAGASYCPSGGMADALA